MTKKKAFLYVGHSNWGKSFAIKKITKNNSRIKHIWLNNKCFKVRKTSNDDDGKSLLRFVQKIPYGHFHSYILTFCPNQQKYSTAKEIIEELKKKFDLYFFIQQKQFRNPENEITQAQMESLRRLGKIKVLTTNEADTERAEQFRKFILDNF